MHAPSPSRNIIIGSALAALFACWAGSSAWAVPVEVSRPAKPTQSHLNRNLLEATERGDLPRMKRLLDLGADPNFRLRKVYGSPILLTAVINGQAEAAALLIERGADPNAKDFRGTPVLVAAASTVTDAPDSALVVRAIHVLLWKGGANPNVADSAYIGDDRSALHLAAASGSVSLVRLLLRFGAHTDQFNRFGETPLYFAAERGQIETARVLLAHGANPDTRTRYTRMSPLMIAADHGRADMLIFLMNQKVDLRARNAFGKTTLDLALAAKERAPASNSTGARLKTAVRALHQALSYPNIRS